MFHDQSLHLVMPYSFNIEHQTSDHISHQSTNSMTVFSTANLKLKVNEMKLSSRQSDSLRLCVIVSATHSHSMSVRVAAELALPVGLALAVTDTGSHFVLFTLIFKILN